MPTKGVTDRQRVAKSLAATARAHAEQVDQRLRETLTPALREGETLPDFLAFQLLLARYLEQRTQEIIAADELHLVEQHDDLEPRRRRDQAATDLHDTLVRIREALGATFGREHIRELAGLERGTAQEPVVLVRQATRVLERLRQPLLTSPTMQLEGLQIDLDVLADQLQPALDTLIRALQDVDIEQRQTETTLREKDLSLDVFDAAVGGIGRILIGCDVLAGLPEFAEKIRLTVPFRRRQNIPSDGEPEPTTQVPETEPPEAPPESEPPVPTAPSESV